MINPLTAIVCGYERGGTTLVSEILRQHPDLDSGFEGGLLFSDNPHDFRTNEPYVTSLKISWGVTDEDLEYICNGSDWQDIYRRLLDKSRKVNSKYIYDKTPKYMENLSEVLSRAKVPCVAIVRDPRALFYSWAKRSELSTEDWCNVHLLAAIHRYKSYGNGLLKALTKKRQKILVVQYESLCVNPEKESKKIMSLLGLDFNPMYVEFANPQKNVHEKNVSSKYIFEYKKQFNEDVCYFIESSLTDFNDWFWHDTSI